jgi:hypothetical protein
VTSSSPSGRTLIHLEKQGSSEGWIRQSRADRLGATNSCQGTALQRRTTSAPATTRRDKIVGLIKDGKSLDEIKVAVGDPPSPPSSPAASPAAAGGRTQGAAPAPGRGGGFASFTEVVYQELTKR